MSITNNEKRGRKYSVVAPNFVENKSPNKPDLQLSNQSTSESVPFSPQIDSHYIPETTGNLSQDELTKKVAHLTK